MSHDTDKPQRNAFEAWWESLPPALQNLQIKSATKRGWDAALTAKLRRDMPTSAREALLKRLEDLDARLPEPWEEDRRYSDNEIARLKYDKETMQDAIRALAASLPGSGEFVLAFMPVAWRYRYVTTGIPSGIWKYANTEQECELSVFYERQPLYEARNLPKGKR